MIYAPVIIPTLNRYEHFKQCLESLENCTGADCTDVYVALDYPPSEKYVDGWEKVDSYLHEKELDNKFKSLIVYRRKENYFFSGKGNGKTAINDLPAEVDRYIFSEDDNLFSRNFLMYVNDALEKYKEDPNCISVCGYNYKGVTLDDYPFNCYFSREYSAWGVGFWRKKRKEIDSIINRNYAESIMSSWHNIWTIYKNEPRLLNTIILNLDCGRIFGDTMIVSYQYLNKKYSLFPKVSKVRNMGFDGSGTSIFEVQDSYSKQAIDTDCRFTVDIVDSSSLDVAAPEVKNNFKRSALMNIVIFIRCIIYYLTRKDILYYEAKRRNKSLFNKAK